MNDWLTRGLKRVRRESRILHEHPEAGEDVMLQLKRMLPAQGYLTERLAKLREHAHRMREGHVARIEEIRDAVAHMPREGKRKLSEQLILRFKELKLDLRLERLDRACAETERRIRDLTEQARGHLARHDFRRVTGILERATKLQTHNTRLFAIIDRTEQKLLHAAREVAQRTPEVTSP